VQNIEYFLTFRKLAYAYIVELSTINNNLIEYVSLGVLGYGFLAAAGIGAC
jgi:hypothetical protein